MLLDACFLIDLMDGDPGATAKLAEIADARTTISTLVYTEVAIGIAEHTTATERFEGALSEAIIVPYDHEAARRAVDLQRSLQHTGNPIDVVDAMLAGTAIARDEPIVTRNVEEFARTPARVSPY